MNLLLSHLEVSTEKLLLRLDLKASLLHRLLKLVLSVCQPVHLIRPLVQPIPQFLDLKPQQVVLYDALLLDLDAIAQRSTDHIILQLQLVNLILESRLFVVELVNLPLCCPVVVIDLLQLLLQHPLLLIRHTQQLLQLVHFCVESLLLVSAVLALRPRHLSLHLLEGKVCVVNVLLLLLALRVQILDLVTEVPVCRLGARDLGNEVCLLLAQSKKLLALPKHVLLQLRKLLLRCPQRLLLLPIELLDLLCALLEVICGEVLVLEALLHVGKLPPR
mmetsp:Transcript_13881/g.32193  ORF Transcript_13881/g.32193 Transcript_13881/m.32193 type:complete len:275 (+) Transcript_13881:865-1689(+)